MALIGEATVAVRPDANPTRFASETRSRLTRPLAGVGGFLGQHVGLAMGAGFAALGVHSLISGAMGEANEAYKATAQTNAVIQSTGGAAKVTAGQVGDLANAISAKVGIDDEAIQSGENMLLTFTNVRNEAGKGNDIFNQATQTVTDMSVALGQSMTSSSIQLGKALNDPIKGVTALQRVGVTFDDQQKKQIATLVKSGNVLGAQKVILKELNKEFAGSAAAQATPAEKARVAWKNLQETIGLRLMPVVGAFASFAVSTLIPAVGKVADAIGFVASGVGDFVHGFTVGIDGLHDPQTRLAQAGAVAYTIFERVKGFVIEQVVPALRQVGGFITGEVVPAFGRVVGIIRDDVIPGFLQIGRALLPGIIAIVGAVRGNLVPIFTNVVHAVEPLIPILKVVGIIVIGALVVAFRVFAFVLANVVVPGIRITTGIIAAVVPVIASIIIVVARVVVAVAGFAARTASLFASVAGAVGSAVGTAVRFIVRIVTTVINVELAIARFYLRVAGYFFSMASAVGRAIGTAVVFVAGLPGRAVGALASLGGLLLSVAASAFGSLLTGAESKVGGLISYVGGIPGQIVSALSGAGSALIGVGSDIVNGLISGIRSMGGAIKDALLALLPGPLRHFAGKLGIGSPSKVFARYGGWISEGLAVGIRAGTPHVDRAVGSLADRVAASRLPGRPGASLPGVPARLSNGSPIHLEIHAAAGQSTAEIARIAIADLDWQLSSGALPPALAPAGAV